MIYCFITYYLIASDKTGETTASFSTPSSNLLIIVTINIPHFSCNIEKSNDTTDSSHIDTSVGNVLGKTIKS